MRKVSQGGVGVRMMNHNHGRNESEWSKCEKKRKESMRIITGSVVSILFIGNRSGLVIVVIWLVYLILPYLTLFRKSPT